jgi:hypothetical protein
MHEDQVLRMALACIRWNQFGECRTGGWPGLPPTAADTVAALEASLAKPHQPVGGALTKQQQCDLATASFCVASVGDPTCHLHADNAERIIELLDSLRLATLSAPVAQPASEITDEQIVAALKACDKEDVTQEGWIWRQRIRWGRAVLALATPIAAQPAAAEPVPSTCDGFEQQAFEDWALGQRYSMGQHPMFYIFLDSATAGARDGWKAGLEYAVKRMLAAPAQAAAVPEAVARPLPPLPPLPPTNYVLATESDGYGEPRVWSWAGYDDEAMRSYARAALSQGDVSGEGEGS